MKDRLQRLRGVVLFFVTALLLVAGSQSVYAEGTKQVRPDTTVSEAGLMIDWADPLFTRFCCTGCPANYRLNIHIKNVGEKIMFGLKTPYASIGWALKRPDGSIPPGMSGTDLPMSGAGYITYYHQAIVGPFPASGGYTPLTYTADVTGDWYFEITDVHTDPNYASFPDCAIFHLWDFQVVTGANTPALPTDTLNGRVWSQSWQMYAKLETPRYYNGSLFVYTDDGIVTKLTCNTMGMGEGTFFCNDYGCLNTGNLITDRQSKNSNTATTWPAIAQYKVFLNNPDTTIYPSGEYGVLNSVSYYNEPGNPCSTNKFFLVNVNKAGRVVIKVDVPYGDATYDVQIVANVVPGDNIIPWNCLDGHGGLVPDGTTITFTVEYQNGLVNLPLWDFERNPFGFKVYPIRPLGPGLNPPMLYWDDSQLTSVGGGTPCTPAPNSVNFTGCAPLSSTCHDWSIMCHNKMVNTWWYSGSSTSTSNSVVIHVAPIPVIAGPATVCIGTTNSVYTTESGMSNYTWNVSAGGTIVSGGGTTNNSITITWNTTGAKTVSVNYTNLSGCTGLAATVYNVNVVNLPVPTIAGPASICQNSAGNVYTTQAGKTNYVWQVSSGGTITAGGGSANNTVTVTWNTAGAQWVSVNYTDGCPGAAPTVYNVTVNPVTIPVITGPNSACRNTNGYTYTTQPGMSGYVWNIPAGGTIVAGQGTNTVTVNWGNSGARTISVTFTNSFGCSPASPTVLNVTVNNSFTASVSIAASANPSCAGSPVTFTATPVNGGSPTITWYLNGVNTGITGLTYTITPANGNAIRCTMTTSLACATPTTTTSNTITMTVNPTLPVSVSIGASANPVCAGTAVNFTAAPVNGGVTPAYQWKVNGVNSGANSNSFNYTPANGDVITCALTSSVTCPSVTPANSNAITMIVNPAAPVSVNIGASANPVCAGTPITFTATPNNGGATPAYQWKVNGINSGSNSNTFNYTPANGDVITCVLTSNAACATGSPATSNSLTMTINPVTAISIQPANVTTGNGTTAVYSVTATGTGLTYQWQENTGSGWNNVINGGIYSGATSPTLTITGVTQAMSGYQYRCIVTGTCGTQTSSPGLLTVTSSIDISCPANINTVADAGICTATLDPGFPTLVTGTLPVTYTWTMSGTTTGSGTGAITPNPFTFNVGVTTISWHATNVDGSDDCSQTVTVTDNQLPVFSAPPARSYCVEDLALAIYWDPTMDITPNRPEYYLFRAGNTDLDLDPASFSDNCPLGCAVEIRWRISFADGSFLPALPATYLTGQPSAYPTDIQFPGSVTNDIIHTITYQIVDCHGNVSLPVTSTVTVTPRPNVIKQP